jgi:Ca-activated chloride channel family protein
MFNPQHFYNSRGDGFPVMEMVGPSEQPRRFVPLQRSELRGRITGPLADLVLEQRFQFSAEQSQAVVEALYRFPLPGDAAIRTVTVRFGDVEIRANLKPRAEAEAEYAAAKEAGKQAVLATRGGPNVFALRVAGLIPDQPITVETAFVQLARPAGVGWSLRVPVTLAPRYVREDEAAGRTSGRPGEALPLGLMRDPGHRFALALTVEGATAIASPTYKLAQEPASDGAGESMVVRLAAGEVLPDRDLVLTWTPPQQAEHPVIQVFAHEDPQTERIYFLAQVAPPRLDAADSHVEHSSVKEKEITLVVDHSGSMSGPKWEAADWATERLLRSLQPQDTFALAVFHNMTFWLDRQLHPATPEQVERAVAWFKARRDSGGTELGVALEQALAIPKRSGSDETGSVARSVLVVTDGQVTDHARLMQLADREFATPDRRRISVLCIDSAPNDYLANQLAERGGGIARFLTSSPGEEDITTALDEILADWAAPALVGLQLTVNRAEVHGVGRRTLSSSGDGRAALDLGDLPAGRVVWVAGSVPHEDNLLELRLELGDGVAIAGAQATVGDYPAVAALAGAWRIAELEYLAQARALEPDEVARRLHDLGYGQARLQPAIREQPTLYPENRSSQWQAAIERLLVEESLAFGLVSSATAFVAVRQEAGQPVTEVVEVANALPVSWSETFLSAAFMPPPTPGGGVVRSLKASLLPRGLAAQSFASSMLPAQGLPMPAEVARQAPVTGSVTLYAGPVAEVGVRAVLLESAPGDATIPTGVALKGLALTTDADGAQALGQARDLVLSVFVGDLVVPRAVVRLRDLLAAGRRPLNVLRQAGEAVQIVLDDQSGAGEPARGRFELRLIW